jgi:hypothetical protein
MPDEAGLSAVHHLAFPDFFLGDRKAFRTEPGEAVVERLVAVEVLVNCTLTVIAVLAGDAHGADRDVFCGPMATTLLAALPGSGGGGWRSRWPGRRGGNGDEFEAHAKTPFLRLFEAGDVGRRRSG